MKSTTTQALAILSLSTACVTGCSGGDGAKATNPAGSSPTISPTLVMNPVPTTISPGPNNSYSFPIPAGTNGFLYASVKTVAGNPTIQQGTSLSASFQVSQLIAQP